MESVGQVQDRATPERSSELPMNEYERARRAIAEQRLDEAMVIIDATFHALSRVRTVLVGIGKFLSGAFMRRRDYSKNGFVHFD